MRQLDEWQVTARVDLLRPTLPAALPKNIHPPTTAELAPSALALLARDKNGPKICFQYLGIPELDDRLQTPSMQLFSDTPIWDLELARLSWKYYLGETYSPGSSNVPIYASPARAEDLRELPPTYISTMEFDPLRDEGILYALKLMQQGVQTELHSCPGTFHGSHFFAEAKINQRFHHETLEVLRRGLSL